MGRVPFAVSVVFAVTSHVLSAQWIHVPIPGTPRTADGKPKLNAPAPKTADGKPDLSGIWGIVRPPNLPTDQPGYGLTLEYWMAPGEKIPQKPEAAALFKQHFGALAAGRPTERCMPHGITDAPVFGPTKILQLPTEVAILYEEFNHFRQIHTDGRALPADMNPSWLGYSVGKWVGDELVVQSAGFNDRTWLDDGGHVHTEAMKTTERYRRTDFGHMQMQMTIDDPGAYTKPFSFTYHFELMPDTELIENICENEKDSSHIPAP